MRMYPKAVVVECPLLADKRPRWRRPVRTIDLRPASGRRTVTSAARRSTPRRMGPATEHRGCLAATRSKATPEVDRQQVEPVSHAAIANSGRIFECRTHEGIDCLTRTEANHQAGCLKPLGRRGEERAARTSLLDRTDRAVRRIARRPALVGHRAVGAGTA